MKLLLLAFGFIDRPITATDCGIAAFAAAFDMWLVYFATQKVTLYEDAIEVDTLMYRRRLNKSEIRGYRMGGLWKEYGTYYVIVPTADRTREVRLRPVFRYDRPFFAWMRSIGRIDSGKRAR